jgi:hypothetical protein
MGRKRFTEARAERHRRAVEQTIQWAIDAAGAGQYQDALSWMRVLETVEGQLPSELKPLRDRCQRVVQERAEAHAARRRQLADAI